MQLRTHEGTNRSWFRWAHVLACVFALPATAAAARGSRAVAPPPPVLNIVRQTLKPGAAPGYAELEAAIVHGYDRAKIPLYWLCLQSTRNPAEILYLNLYKARSDADRAAAVFNDEMKRHPDLVKLQQRLTALGAAPPRTALTTRRDEFDFKPRGADFSSMAALDLTIIHVQPGREGEFVEALQTGRASAWQIYEDSASPTFYVLMPLKSARQRAEGMPRALRRARHVYTAEKPVTYVLRPAMSRRSARN
jgi:hypothetical protein